MSEHGQREASGASADSPFTDASPKVRAAVRTYHPMVAIAQVLAPEKSFQSRVARVRETELEEDRMEIALALASDYVKRGLGRETFAALLLRAASADPRFMVTRLMNAGRGAVWSGAELDPGDAKRGLRSDAAELYLEASSRLRRRGAGQCIECGRTLAAATTTSAGGGPSAPRTIRVDYCEGCGRDEDRKAHARQIEKLLADLRKLAL